VKRLLSSNTETEVIAMEIQHMIRDVAQDLIIGCHDSNDRQDIGYLEDEPARSARGPTMSC
jgi:hypothetical protein